MPEIPKACEPQAVEAKWYQFWLDQGCFTADPASPKPAYSVVISPPNVTGVLHVGHVLNSTIQGTLSREARVDGKEVLWLPGTDCAGIRKVLGAAALTYVAALVQSLLHLMYFVMIARGKDRE